MRQNLVLTSFWCFTLVEDQAREFLCHVIDFITTFFFDEFPCHPFILFSFLIFTLITTIPAKISCRLERKQTKRREKKIGVIKPLFFFSSGKEKEIWDLKINLFSRISRLLLFNYFTFLATKQRKAKCLHKLVFSTRKEKIV